MSHVYVLVEHAQGALAPVSAELITAARSLGAVSAVVVGADAAALAPQLAHYGAVQVVDVQVPDYADRLITPEVDALHALASANPAPVVLAASARGNDIAGRLAARLASGALLGVSSLGADGSATHSIFGGAVETTAQAAGASPVYTVRPGAVSAQEVAAPGEAQLAAMALPAAAERDVQVRSFEPAVGSARPELTAASVVVAGGRGVGDAFAAVVEPLADILGGAVGATRDAVDEGYYDRSAQIGQTGATVSPQLYIGLGISGAIQHTVGMQTADTIVVINEDRDEPFFEIADLGVVGDVHDIAPALRDALAAHRDGNSGAQAH